MEFVAVLFQTIVKMLVIGAVAFGGICLGKKLRDRKDEKESRQPAE